jgi:hypothetical protein
VDVSVRRGTLLWVGCEMARSGYVLRTDQSGDRAVLAQRGFGEGFAAV